MAKLVSNTYGDALFEVAVEDGTVDTLFDEAKTVLEVLETNPEYTKLLTHPKLPVEEKITLIESVFKGKTSDNFTGFLVTIVDKGRFAQIDEILGYFISKVQEYKKIGVAYVTSAAPMSDVQKNEMEQKLLATTKYEEFIMHFDVDESLIGGAIIRIGDRVVDSSIKTKLNQMAKDLSQIQLSN